ncbi:LysR family transcriptional regulator [Deinococcus sonorensis]|uniref:LysR family transcriptional regulator n=2 Tax=Deinococcus sonorensis TaxID=309891 RepID=A0AAU7UA33_9DEIO
MTTRTSPVRPTLAQLRVFVAVAQAGAFSEAAAELGMSQSTLSEGVASLERTLGVQLFRRGAGGATLTGAGEQALAHAVRAVQASEDLSISLQTGSALSGTLTVAAYRSLGVHVLPPVLAALHRQHPGLNVRVLNAQMDSEGGQRLILSGQADVGLMSVAEDTALLVYPLAQDEYVAVQPVQNGAQPLSWTDLEGQTLLLPPATDSCHRLVMRHLQQHGVVPGMVMEIAEDDVIYSMVAHGVGIAIQPGLAVSPLPGGLMTLPLPVPLSRSMGVAVLPQRAGLPHIWAFMAALSAAWPSMDAQGRRPMSGPNPPRAAR